MLNGTRSNGAGAAIPAADSHDIAWDALPPAVTSLLKGPIDPALVSRREGRGGMEVEYIEGSVAIAEANRIFGHGGWGHDLAGDIELREIGTVQPGTGDRAISRAYCAPVRVTVVGAPARVDIGFCAVQSETAEGHEAAIKGAVTDGIRRALRTFGDRFGLSLRCAPPPESPQADDATGELLRSALVRLCSMQGYGEEQVREAVRTETGTDLGQVSCSDLAALIDGAAAKLAAASDRDPLP